MPGQLQNDDDDDGMVRTSCLPHQTTSLAGTGGQQRWLAGTHRQHGWLNQLLPVAPPINNKAASTRAHNKLP